MIPPNTSRVVELKIPSQLGYERVAREAVAAVARRLGFSSERVDELKTAVDEACTNAIRHGSNADARMKVIVLLTADETKLDILVKDAGAGEAPAGTGRPTGHHAISGRVVHPVIVPSAISPTARQL